MSMTEDARGEGETQAQEASFSSGSREGSLAPVMAFERNWDRYGYCIVNMTLKLKSAVGGTVLLSWSGRSTSLGQLLPGGSGTTYTTQIGFSETQRVGLKVTVISSPNNTPNPFEVLDSTFTLTP